MTWSRRNFLASSATICAAAAVAGSAFTPSRARERLRLLRSRGEVPSGAFERGVRTALGGHGPGPGLEVVTMPVRFDFDEWRALAAAIAPAGAVLGVVRASEFVLVNELIRDAGARLLHQGEHAVDDAGSARHALASGAALAGVGAALRRSPGAWPEALGFALARAAVPGWQPAGRMTGASPGPGSAPPRTSCVSFLFAS